MNESFAWNTGSKHPEKVPVEDFDHGDIDSRNNWHEPGEVEEEPQEAHDGAEALRALVQLLTHRAGPDENSARVVGLRVYALKEILFPSEESMSKIAARLGVSRSLMSHHGKRLRDELGIKGRWQRSETARRNLSKSTGAAWKRKKEQEGQ